MFEGQSEDKREDEKMAWDHPTGGNVLRNKFLCRSPIAKGHVKEEKKKNKKKRIMDASLGETNFIARKQATWAPGEVMKRHR